MTAAREKEEEEGEEGARHQNIKNMGSSSSREKELEAHVFSAIQAYIRAGEMVLDTVSDQGDDNIEWYKVKLEKIGNQCLVAPGVLGTGTSSVCWRDVCPTCVAKDTCAIQPGTGAIYYGDDDDGGAMFAPTCPRGSPPCRLPEKTGSSDNDFLS